MPSLAEEMKEVLADMKTFAEQLQGFVANPPASTGTETDTSGLSDKFDVLSKKVDTLGTKLDTVISDLGDFSDAVAASPNVSGTTTVDPTATAPRAGVSTTTGATEGGAAPTADINAGTNTAV